MKQYRIYVVEDMAFSRAALINLLEESNFHVAGSAANALKAWENLQKIDIDLALLDINLAGKQDGIWLATKIRESLDIPIVFLTAYGDDNTLSKLNHLNPNGYLMKPYNKPTLLTTINIALKSYESLHSNIKIDLDKFIIIEESGQKTKLFLGNILYIVSDGNYLEIHKTNKKHIIRTKLSAFLDSLPENNFIVQTHLRYAVNVDKISSISTSNLLIDTIEIPISKTYKQLVLDRFNSSKN